MDWTIRGGESRWCERLVGRVVGDGGDGGDRRSRALGRTSIVGVSGFDAGEDGSRTRQVDNHSHFVKVCIGTQENSITISLGVERIDQTTLASISAVDDVLAGK